MHKLLNKWQCFLASVGVEQDTALTVFTQIVEAYSSPNRYYHNLEHIEHVLKTIDLHNQTRDLVAVQFAAWFHDAVYDSHRQDNEEKSADYATALLTSLGIPSNIIATVNRLILNTKYHQAASDDIDSQVLLDADLAILGDTPNKYHKYALAIRQEYAWLSKAEYIAGRKRVLQRFLQRHRIYFTEPMFQTFELSARNNLEQEIQAMSD